MSFLDILTLLFDTAKDNLFIVVFMAIGYFIHWTTKINSQINNHLTTQIKDLKESIKDLEDNQKEMREDIKALNQKIDQNFKELVLLITKNRAD